MLTNCRCTARKCCFCSYAEIINRWEVFELGLESSTAIQATWRRKEIILERLFHQTFCWKHLLIGRNIYFTDYWLVLTLCRPRHIDILYIDCSLHGSWIHWIYNWPEIFTPLTKANFRPAISLVINVDYWSILPTRVPTISNNYMFNSSNIRKEWVKEYS